MVGWKILWHCGVPEKITSMIRVLRFTMASNQGSCPLLVAVDLGVSRQALGDNETGIKLTLLQKLEELHFAHLVLLRQKIAHRHQKFEALRTQAARVGLKVNATKTREMSIRSRANTGNISCA